MNLSLKHLWVISESGVSLFSIKVNQVNADNIVGQILFNEADKYRDYMKAAAVYAALDFITGAIVEIQDGCFETGNLLWAVYPKPIKYKFKSNLPKHNKSTIYRVIALAEIDPDSPIGTQKTQLLAFCKYIFMDFYAAFGKDIEHSLRQGVSNFKGYKPRCVSIMESDNFTNLLQPEEQIIPT